MPLLKWFTTKSNYQKGEVGTPVVNYTLLFYDKNDTLIIHAINESFIYDISNSHNIEHKYHETNCNYTFILNLVSTILEMKKKFIFQDYTGNDTTNIYCEFLNIFDSNELLKYVNFDVTQKDSGCYIKISSDMIKYDSYNDFIQEKFLLLTRIKEFDTFKDILKYRIDLLNYELLWSYNKSIETNEYHFLNINKIKFLCRIYQFDSRFIDYNTELLFAID